ncbi:MAG: glycoside hydrolase family 92 protein, partial [Opitutales bacterium]|nr:glycoside hydrolase family 92 protein [Opitutales bacterium]
MPGDEDGGSMSSFYVFSALGFYPVTPGMPMYVIGTPFFKKAEINLKSGKKFTVVANNYATNHKYIQSAKLNGKPLNRSWITHDEIMNGGVLEFEMGLRPNKTWATTIDAVPPSFEFKK